VPEKIARDKSEIDPVVLLSETVTIPSPVAYDKTEIHNSEKY
jgi:hypothetical protein